MPHNLPVVAGVHTQDAPELLGALGSRRPGFKSWLCYPATCVALSRLLNFSVLVPLLGNEGLVPTDGFLVRIK